MATKQPIDASLVARVAGGLKDWATSWFGPSDPIQPNVPADQQSSVEGRQFDYPVAYNRSTQPRAYDAVSFSQLRALADSCDVLRIVIETRKDQLAKLNWIVRPKDGTKESDARCQEMIDFFMSPDKEHDWDTWLRMLLEDLFVVDAPALYVRNNLGGGVYAIEPVDGGTIKRVLDDRGRTPMPPEPAYQQVLKGLPSVNYTVEELIYRPRNVRTSKVYGFSPVEQIILTVNIALRRAVHKLQYYTEGNVPEAIIGLPDNYSTDQVAQFQRHWDSLNEGNTAERRHAKFVPGKLDIHMTKEDVLKDAFDEWLARIVCYAFSIEPTAFVHQQNRATAESAREAALSEGLAPVQKWVVNMMNHIIWNVFGYKDLVFDWADEEVQDALERAQVDKIYLDSGVITPDEVRTDLGLEPLSDEQLARISAAKAPPPMLIQPGMENGNAAPGAEPVAGKPRAAAPPGTNPKPGAVPAALAKGEVAKAKKSVPGPIDQDRAAIVKQRKILKDILTKFLAKQAKKVAAEVGAKLGKADEPDSKERAGRVLADINFEWDSLVPEVSVALGAVVLDGAESALKEVGSELPAPAQDAAIWAQDRAAEMVGMKWVDGELVENPEAEWVITDSTREMIQLMVAEAIDNGETMDDLASTFEDAFAFSPERAETIARTETRMADSAGQMKGYEESGVVEGTEWTTAEDDLVSEECQANQDAGMVPLGDAYPSGDDAPPAHPNCRCVIVAVLIDKVGAGPDDSTPTDDNSE